MAKPKKSTWKELGPDGRVFVSMVLIGVLLTALGRSFLMAGTPEIVSSGLVRVDLCQRTELVMQACQAEVLEWDVSWREPGSRVEVLSYTTLAGEVPVVERDRWISYTRGEDEVYETVRVIVPEGLWLPTRWVRNVVLIPTLFAFLAAGMFAGEAIKRRNQNRSRPSTD